MKPDFQNLSGPAIRMHLRELNRAGHTGLIIVDESRPDTVGGRMNKRQKRILPLIPYIIIGFIFGLVGGNWVVEMLKNAGILSK